MTKEKDLLEAEKKLHKKEIGQQISELEGITNTTSLYPAGVKEKAGDILAELRQYKKQIKRKKYPAEKDYDNFNTILVKITQLYSSIKDNGTYAELKQEPEAFKENKQKQDEPSLRQLIKEKEKKVNKTYDNMKNDDKTPGLEKDDGKLETNLSKYEDDFKMIK